MTDEKAPTAEWPVFTEEWFADLRVRMDQFRTINDQLADAVNRRLAALTPGDDHDGPFWDGQRTVLENLKGRMGL